MIRIELTPEELTKLYRNAVNRDAPKNARGIKAPNTFKKTTLELHLLEVTGQYAVSKYLDEPMDWSIKMAGNKTGIHLYASGFSLCVQTPSYHPPILKFNRASDFTADLAVLCYQADQNIVDIHGCVSRERFLREHLKQNFGHGNRLTMPSWNLTSIEEFEAEAESGLRKTAARESGNQPSERKISA
jgi:hypothetical protein